MVEVLISIVVFAGIIGWMLKTSLKKQVSKNPVIGGGGSIPEEPKGPINEQ